MECKILNTGCKLVQGCPDIVHGVRLRVRGLIQSVGNLLGCCTGISQLIGNAVYIENDATHNFYKVVQGAAHERNFVISLYRDGGSEVTVGNCSKRIGKLFHRPHRALQENEDHGNDQQDDNCEYTDDQREQIVQLCEHRSLIDIGSEDIRRLIEEGQDNIIFLTSL